MWSDLWRDFNDRSLALLNEHPPNDATFWCNEWNRMRSFAFDANHHTIDMAVDWTIRWQLIAQPPYMRDSGKVPIPIELNNLQLPELYSGHPWALKNQKPWIAFVTANPSISPLEIFPTRAHLPANINDATVQHIVAFFEERFDPGPLVNPVLHGLHEGRPVAYTDRPVSQRTWAMINDALIACMNANHIGVEASPLGQRAAIIDVVPWKFRAWGQVPNPLKMALITAANPYLDWVLREHPPAFIVAAGEHARKAMHRLFPQLPIYARNVLVQNGGIEINGKFVQWRGVPAPTARGNQAFRQAMQAIGYDLAQILAD